MSKEADAVFDAAAAIAREVVDERSLGSKLSEIQQRAMHERVPTHRDAFFEDIINGQRRAMDQAASEFVAPYLRRIAKLEAENKALCDAARLFADEYEKAKEVTMPVDAHIAAMSLISILPHEHKFARCGSDIGGTHLEKCACGKVRPIDTGAS